MCESPKAKEASPETESDEIPPPPKIRGLHKPAIKVNPKDVIQNMIHKGNKLKTPALPNTNQILVHKPHVKKEREHEPEKLKPTPAKEDDDDDDDSDVSAEKITKKTKRVKKDDDDDDSEVSPEKIAKKPKEVKVGKEVKETQTIRPKSKKKKQERKQEEGIRFPNTIPIFSATSSAVQSELCRKHSRLFLRQLERYKMWALLSTSFAEDHQKFKKFTLQCTTHQRNFPQVFYKATLTNLAILTNVSRSMPCSRTKRNGKTIREYKGGIVWRLLILKLPQMRVLLNKWLNGHKRTDS